MTAPRGLYEKFHVTKVSTGETIEDCFVLRPERDHAALAALRAYALWTDDLQLENDLRTWIYELEQMEDSE
jgi:hypothetical protein